MFYHIQNTTLFHFWFCGSLFVHKAFKDILTHPFKFYRDFCFCFFLFLNVALSKGSLSSFFAELTSTIRKKAQRRKIPNGTKSHQIICGIKNEIFFFFFFCGGFGLVFVSFVNWILPHVIQSSPNPTEPQPQRLFGVKNTDYRGRYTDGKKPRAENMRIPRWYMKLKKSLVFEILWSKSKGSTGTFLCCRWVGPAGSWLSTCLTNKAHTRLY